MYGPYSLNNGRKLVSIYDTETKKLRSQSYPRFLMEQKLQRQLSTNEEVDHVNEDHTKDDLENLQVLTKQEHYLKTFQNRKRRQK